MASLTPTLIALAADSPSLLERLGYQLDGVLVVFLALSSIWLALEIIGRIFRRPVAEKPAAAPVAAPAPSPTPPAPAGIPSEVLAAIAVAVHVTLGDRARVSAVVPVPATQAWAQEGRRQIFSSHNPS